MKRAHFQVATWYSTMNPHPPNLNPIFYGWVRDETNKILCLCPVGIPEGISPVPPEVLNLIKCDCSSNKHCSSKRCLCVSTRVACSMLCQCRGDTQHCFNEETKLADDLLADNEDQKVCCCWIFSFFLVLIIELPIVLGHICFKI